MATKREKTVSYRRAEWIDDVSGLTLEKCIRDALAALKSIVDRTISQGGQEAKIISDKNGPSGAGGLLLHLTTETPGESASIVPKAIGAAQEVALGSIKPPPGGEWLDGDAFLFVNDDHVCLCSTGIRDGAVRHFFYELFKKAKLRKDSTRFDLLKVADISKVKLLHNQGVSELEIRATLYKATADYEKRKNRAAGALGIAGRHLRAILNKPNDVTPDSLRVFLGLKVDKRFTKSIALGEKRIEQLAADVVRHNTKDEDYVIITKKGQRISTDEIFMKSKVLIDSDGKTVQRDKAYRELVSFFNDLKNTGVLEQ